MDNYLLWDISVHQQHTQKTEAAVPFFSIFFHFTLEYCQIKYTQNCHYADKNVLIFESTVDRHCCPTMKCKTIESVVNNSDSLNKKAEKG